MIEHRIATSRLHPLHRGAYCVGHRSVTLQGRWLAAVLACGPGALLSHRDAAALWGLAPAAAGPFDVTGTGKGRPRIRIHRSRTLHVDERAECDSIPVTSVSRTILDLAGVLDRRRLLRAIERAEQLDVFDLRSLERACNRNRGRRGVGTLRSVLTGYREPQWTLSPLERRFLDFCEDSGLPAPETNVTVEGFLVDALWLRQRLVVELDSFEFHRSRASFEQDRRRDSALQRAEYRVLRITGTRLGGEPGRVAAEIRELLRLRSRG